MLEGNSRARPPLFSGSIIIERFMDIVVKEPRASKSIVDVRTIVKPFEEWDENDKNLCSISA